MEALVQRSTFHHLAREDLERLACQSPHPQPDPSLFAIQQQQNKRKRADSHDVPVAQSVTPAVTTTSTTSSPQKKCRLDAATNNAVSAVATSIQQAAPVVNQISTTSQSQSQASSSQATAPSMPVMMSEPVVEPTEAPAAMTKPKARPSLDRALEKVEAHINLEILLKHNELRLIEQELAKCQIALEQLRRCEVIPWPTEKGSPLTMLDVHSGTGPSVEPAAGLVRPSRPAPWGVTDGPYTRHYAHWLIPDATFDPSLPPETPASARSSYFSMDRSHHRPSVAERQGFPSARSQRYANSAKFQALPSAYAQPKDRSQPLILKRQNGEYVKLICKWCGKHNISSVQGFLNHCRIAHQHNYLSHEAAAADCGHPLEGEEAAATTAGAAPAPAVKTPAVAQAPTTPAVAVAPAKSVPATPISTPVVQAPPAAAALLSGRPTVHPLITNLDKTSGISQPGQLNVENAAHRHNLVPKSVKVKMGATTPAAPGPRPALLESPLAPNLSSLMRKRGIDGNLKQAVVDAKVKCDIDSIPSLVADEDVAVETPKTSKMPNSGRTAQKPGISSNVNGQPASFSTGRNFGHRIIIPNSASTSFNGTSTPADPSTAGSNVPSNYVFTPNLEPGSFLHPNGAPTLDTPINSSRASPAAEGLDLSPRTIDSNPGMVTDHEDDDDGELDNADSDVAMRDTDSQDNVRIHDHDYHHSDSHGADGQHHQTLCSDVPMFAGQDQTSTSAAAEPPRKKRGRPSKKDKLLMNQK